MRTWWTLNLIIIIFVKANLKESLLYIFCDFTAGNFQREKKFWGERLSDFYLGGLDPMGGGEFAGEVGPLVDTMPHHPISPHPSYLLNSVKLKLISPPPSNKIPPQRWKKRRRIPPGAYSRHNGMKILYASSMFWHVFACMREVVVARKFLPKFNIWQKWSKIVLKL